LVHVVTYTTLTRTHKKGPLKEKQLGQAGGGEGRAGGIGQGEPGGAEDGFGVEVAACVTAPSMVGGPAGGGPVAGEEKAGRSWWICAGRKRFNCRARVEQVALASLMTVALTSCASRAAGSAWRISFQAEVDDFFAGFFEQVVGRADDEPADIGRQTDFAAVLCSPEEKADSSGKPGPRNDQPPVGKGRFC